MYRLVLREPVKRAAQRTIQQNHSQSYHQNGLPPNTRQAGFGRLFVFLTPFAIFGGTITYANYDSEFRKYLETNIPGAGYILKVMLKDSSPFSAFIQQIDSIKKQIDSATSNVTNFFNTNEPKKSTSNTDIIKTKAKQTEAATPTKSSPDVVKTTKPSKTAVAQKPNLESLPAEITDLEHAVEVAANVALKEYNKAIDILKSFNDDVVKIVDQAVENLDPSLWSSLKNKTAARDSSISTAEKLAQEALLKIEKCEVALAKFAKPENHEQIFGVRNKVKDLMDHINKAKDELYKNKDLAQISEKYWKNVEKARNYFVSEIESIFPGLDLTEKRLNMSQDDFDLFIMHAYSHILTLQKELQRLQTDGELRLKRALSAVRDDNNAEATKAQLEYMLEAEKRKLAFENQKKIFHIRAEAEKQLRQQLKQQTEIHLDLLQEMISLKENELKQHYAQKFEDEIAAEKSNYKLQLAAMLGKMRGLDMALQVRADTERSTHQAQALWAACQTLWSTVRSAEPSEDWRNKLRPLKNEINAIAKVAEGDDLVAVVIENLPKEAAERGVFPEDALRQRFLNVERVARKVATVPEKGASLPKYFLSYLQSIFIIGTDNPISQDEIENKIFDYSKLDTYDILNRSRYYIDRGNLMMALKYMNLLQGAPRKIASEWIKETRLLLETQQAANTLMAHAAANGMLLL